MNVAAPRSGLAAKHFIDVGGRYSRVSRLFLTLLSDL